MGPLVIFTYLDGFWFLTLVISSNFLALVTVTADSGRDVKTFRVIGRFGVPYYKFFMAYLFVIMNTFAINFKDLGKSETFEPFIIRFPVSTFSIVIKRTFITLLVNVLSQFLWNK